MKTKMLLVVALVLGLVLRGWEAKERFNYNHDNDLASWIVKDIVIDHHPRLIGQLTSEPGIFIGPLFYYLLVPFYLMSNFDPIGGVALPIILGLFGIASCWYVFNKLFGKPEANLATLIYAVSMAISQAERDVVPTMPVFLWTVWFFYGINLLFQGNKRSLLILAILVALIWHLNLALALGIPLILLGLAKNWRKFTPKDFIVPVLIGLFVSLPLIVFEARHGFQQTKSLVTTITKPKTGEAFNIAAKVDHTTTYMLRNINWIFVVDKHGWNMPGHPTFYFAFVLLLAAWIIFSLKNKQFAYGTLLYPVWILLYLVFFVFHSINLSEYYLHGLNIVWIGAAAVGLAGIARKHRGGLLLVAILVTLFLGHHIGAFFTQGNQDIGYEPRKAAVEYIRQDAEAHGYPCIAISYITAPGYNFGYRYLFWLAGLHVNQPSSMSPVYSIVFPHKMVDHIDMGFEAIGVIHPDYDRYTKEGIAKSCEGDDANLTDTMFGFTK